MDSNSTEGFVAVASTAWCGHIFCKGTVIASSQVVPCGNNRGDEKKQGQK